MARRKDGSASYLEVSLSRWVSQSRVLITAILRDVNERRVAQEILRASEAQFRTLAQAMPNHVWTARPDGQLDWFNERVYEYSGVKPGTLDGEGWSTLVHPDDMSAAAELWQGCAGVWRALRSAISDPKRERRISLASRSRVLPLAGLTASFCAGSAAIPTSRIKRSPHRRWPTSTQPLNSGCLNALAN